MVENKKKLIPKLKKKIWAFLTDESWKITKKDALWLWVWAMMIGAVEDVMATWHSNWCTSSTSNPQYVSGTLDNKTNDWEWTSERDVHCATLGNLSVSHASWIVNWHYSATPWFVSWTKPSLWHSSHWSHWSHWSHGSRR